MKFILFSAILLIACEIAFASKILFLFPTPSKSHVLVAQGLSTSLAEKGHEVTFFSSYPLSKPMKNYRDFKTFLSEEADEQKEDMVKNPNQSKIKGFSKIQKITSDMAEKMLAMPEFKKILVEEKFDLLIVGIFFNNYLLAFGDHFKCPTMILSVAGAFSSTNKMMGNPDGVSAVPHMMSGLSAPMNFFGRLKTFLLTGAEMAMMSWMEQTQKKFYK